jgi:hypothetical protein
VDLAATTVSLAAPVASIYVWVDSVAKRRRIDPREGFVGPWDVASAVVKLVNGVRDLVIGSPLRTLRRLSVRVRRVDLWSAGGHGLLALATLLAPARTRSHLVAAFTDIEDLPRGRARLLFGLRALLATIVDRLGEATTGAPANPRDERVVSDEHRRVRIWVDPHGGVTVEFEEHRPGTDSPR